MNSVKITDMTLSFGAKALSFKEKIEIARLLDKLQVDVIELPKISDSVTDSLLVRTVCAFVKNSTLSVDGGRSKEEIDLAVSAVSKAQKSRLKICIPTSTVTMEYDWHTKPQKLLEAVNELFSYAKGKCTELELVALDATRADREILKSIVDTATKAGADSVCFCDNEGIMLPDEFCTFIEELKANIASLEKTGVAIMCQNTNSMATANALMSIKCGVGEIKTCVESRSITDTKVITEVLSSCGEKMGVCTSLNANEFKRITAQIAWFLGMSDGEKGAGKAGLISKAIRDEERALDKADSIETVTEAVLELGYELSAEDYAKVYEEFIRVTERKMVGMKELDAIVASVALQVPPTYVLESYVINNGNKISSSAQVSLKKDGKELFGVCIGDGPVDAAFKAIEQIIGTHYELDDFQIQAVTEGREAMGSALVRLRQNGKVYSGNGISTDIIGSAIRAYINAVNKIVYEEK